MFLDGKGCKDPPPKPTTKSTAKPTTTAKTTTTLTTSTTTTTTTSTTTTTTTPWNPHDPSSWTMPEWFNSKNLGKSKEELEKLKIQMLSYLQQHLMNQNTA